jgi:uncharacterized SAM-binding protein YcdF (DUF218 family)
MRAVASKLESIRPASLSLPNARSNGRTAINTASRPNTGQTSHGFSRYLCGSKGRGRLLAVIAILAVLGSGAWVGGDWFLRSAADLWIVSDPIGQADAVAVFGGGRADRPFAAAEYYRQGLVKKILVSNERQSPAEKLNVTTSEVALTEGVLVELGVPASAIEAFGDNLGNTHDEAVALRAWAARNNARRIIVPTEIFSARRVRWMLHRAFGGGFIIRVVALNQPQFRRDDWWQSSQGINSFLNEIVKYIFYRVNY